MPPKPKFTREQLVDAAFELVREQGVDALVARELAKRLNTTTTPIFTFFNSMDELKAEVYSIAVERITAYLRESFNYYPTFKEFGLRWVKIAKHDPHLYSLLFLQTGAIRCKNGLLTEDFQDVYTDIKTSIVDTFGISTDEAEELFDVMSVYAQGLASMFALGYDIMKEEEFDRLVTKLVLSYVAGCKIKTDSLDLKMAKEMLSNEGKTPVHKSEIKFT
ncbi:MAG: TetR family transcriptional regulator [Saccharofermentans sp.]|nr:TetR family transcriptional regulator [Saccharofermentans sp.]